MADEITLNIADVVSEYGAYYIDNGQNMKDLKKRLYAPSETATFFKPYPTNDTVVRGADADISEVLQAYQDTFTPKGDSTMKPATINLFNLKIDWAKNPQSLVSSWLGFLSSSDLDRTKWPFIQYLIQTHIIPKRDEDHELKAAFKGIYAAPTPGTAGAADASMNGLEFIINKAVDDSLITPITTGALETDPVDFCTQVEDFVKSINDLYTDKIDFIFMSKVKFALYKTGKRKKYNQNYAQEDLVTIADYDNIKVQGLRSMKDSGKLWATIPDNRVRPLKRSGDGNIFKVEGAKRVVSIYTDWWEALAFWFPELVFTNDQDLN